MADYALLQSRLFHPIKTVTMPILLIIEAVLKAVLIALGVAAVKGCHWAFVVFLIMLGLMIVFDVVLAVNAIHVGKDIRRLQP